MNTAQEMNTGTCIFNLIIIIILACQRFVMIIMYRHVYNGKTT